MSWIEKGNAKLLKAKINNPILVEIIYCAATILLTVGITFLIHYINVPNPEFILATLIVLFTTVFGYISGAFVVLISIIYSLYFFSVKQGSAPFVYTSENLYKVIIVIVFSIICYGTVSLLKRRQNKYINKLAKLNKFLELDNEQLQQISISDTLTRTKNRFALRKDFDKYSNEYVHVMMFDVDNFKNINDSLGHSGGDNVLKQIGMITTSIFGTESCYRYGGDEFLIIAIDISEEDFHSKVKDLKQAIREIKVGDKNVLARFSGGYVYGLAENTFELRAMIKQADTLLYKVKESGKDDTKSEEFKH